ncbi:PIN domain-containing protein [Stenotrophomonas maltophilia]|uniref:PIN like domain-containing protein n=1 Tax=Stenotrophomonas maltophilia (strain K279a) TaxID=522373 RepID=B2FIX2_STRMK|nr:PIN domain-containing protein [Stenotrophomonas maltophilia]CAQ43901.1 conserved hypothetical protein [Stenotrophomonas maltophilia K279a]
MRAEFLGYFEPSARDIARMWKGATIALDTNVLLGLYRMPRKSREEIFEVLKSVRDRLWVPYHVLVEYHSNRLNTLRDEFEAAEKMERDFRGSFVDFKAIVTEEKVTKRACWPELSEKFVEIEAKAKELYAIARKERSNYIAPSDDDEIRDFLEKLLEGRIGARPSDQSVVDAAEEIAAKRYASGLGPGHLDEKKIGTHLVDGLVYQRQYGDYMVWAGLIEHCQREKPEGVIFVTSDVKDDWWLDTRGKAGKKPQPELVMEMQRVARVRDFGMYTLSTFAANAKSRLKLKVDDQTITDALQAEHVAPKFAVQRGWMIARGASHKNGEPLGVFHSHLEGLDYKNLLESLGAKTRLLGSVGTFGIRNNDDGTTELVLVAGLRMMTSSLESEGKLILRRMADWDEASAWHIYLVPDSDEKLVGRASFKKRVGELIAPYVPAGTSVTIHIGDHTGPGKLAYAFTSEDG